MLVGCGSGEDDEGSAGTFPVTSATSLPTQGMSSETGGATMGDGDGDGDGDASTSNSGDGDGDGDASTNSGDGDGDGDGDEEGGAANVQYFCEVG